MREGTFSSKAIPNNLCLFLTFHPSIGSSALMTSFKLFYIIFYLFFSDGVLIMISIELLFYFIIDLFINKHMNGYYQQPTQYSQATNTKWPYIEAKNYNDWESVLQAFPHLKNINSEEPIQNSNIVNGIVIRSANDDNVHKAIKFGIWTTTPKNKSKIDQLWQRKLNNGTNTYLFFSAVKSGMFEGVARLNSGYHQQTFPFWWENHTLKFKGYFEIEWVYIKDVNNKYFAGLANTEGQEVIKSKDCDTLDSQTTLKMLSIFGKKKAKRNIFTDFAYMDERQRQYIRKMYEVTAYYSQFNMGYNGFEFNQFSMVGHPLNLMSNPNQMAPPQLVPPQNIQPLQPPVNPLGGLVPKAPLGVQAQRSNLGFQMNPVSKNKKK